MDHADMMVLLVVVVSLEGVRVNGSVVLQKELA
jgi:hypothetical protein